MGLLTGPHLRKPWLAASELFGKNWAIMWNAMNREVMDYSPNVVF
jgi:hypothetical protein